MRGQGLNPVTTWGDKTGEGGSCVTSKAEFGRCMSFKSCYPYFKKVPNLGIFDSWVLGNYDTCTFFTDDGRQAFGVCCNNPHSLIDHSTPVPQLDNNLIISNKETFISNWPPPIPTHPPNHAAPTHPPVSGSWPSGVIPLVTTTRRPIVITTKRPGSYPWPPPLPTHPTVTTTTESDSDETNLSDVGNYCGAKNGNQDQERIVGGQNASPNEWPWIAGLFNGNRQFCGGSLIDKNHILTAAHCIAQ